MLTLWQTNLLRRTKLTVLDEVGNGLSFYDYTFLREVPRLHCALEDRLNEEDSSEHGELASFLRMGSWIGGDRDGNPFVTADVMRGTLRLQSSRACASISRNCTRSAPSCRSPHTWPMFPMNCENWQSARPIRRRIAAASPIVWRYRGSMRGWPRPR